MQNRSCVAKSTEIRATAKTRPNCSYGSCRCLSSYYPCACISEILVVSPPPGSSITCFPIAWSPHEPWPDTQSAVVGLSGSITRPGGAAMRARPSGMSSAGGTTRLLPDPERLDPEEPHSWPRAAPDPGPAPSAPACCRCAPAGGWCPGSCSRCPLSAAGKAGHPAAGRAAGGRCRVAAGVYGGCILGPGGRLVWMDAAA